ncbi:hypothetical protein EGW08_016230 [Elysia chlorotica]|uniref:Uncharacterized protein n=1 Tax=Elysia chlorotica TaxID=188477 RepID=A0A433T355_ELYCH|nr:hypothetical protein EGW08_016230 [Elysia chlorotica]
MGIGKTAPVVCLLLIALGSRVGVMAHGKRLEERSYGSFPLNATSTTNTSTVTAATTALAYTQSDFIVTVLDVSRVRQSAGYLFTVRYVPHAQNVRVAYVLAAVKSQQETYSHLYELQAVAEQGGVRSVSFGWSFADYDGTDNNIVYFMTDTERVGIKVFMDPGTSGNLKTALHPWPLTVSPADQLVYRPGQDTPLLDIQYTNSTSMNLDIVMVNLRTGDAEFGEMVDHSSYFLSTIR